MKMFSKLSSKKFLIAVATLILVGAGVTYAYSRTTDKNRNETNTPDTEETINFNPATDEEKQEVENNKQRIVDEQNNPTDPGDEGSVKQVTVTVTGNDNSGVYAQVSGVIEDGGACSAKFTKGSTTLNATSDSIANVSYTQCAPLRPNPSLTAGDWQVVVSYKSTKAEGVSQPFSFTVH